MNRAAIKRWRQRTLSSKRSENFWGNKIVVFLRLADIIFNGHACEAPHISTWWSDKKVQRELRDMSLHFLLPRTSYLKANGRSWKHNKRCSLVKSSTSPRIRIWNHHIKNNIDQQQWNTQQDLFGGAELFHFLISYFYVVVHVWHTTAWFITSFCFGGRKASKTVKKLIIKSLWDFSGVALFCTQGFFQVNHLPYIF